MVKRATTLLLCLIAGPLLAGPSQPLLVNGIAATVGKELITVQDAYFFRALQRFREGDPNPLRLEEGSDLRRTVHRIIFEEMVQEEMKSLKFEEKTTPEEVRRLLQVNRTHARDRQWSHILAHFGKTESNAIEVLSRSLSVDKFMKRKVETLTPIITQADIERYIKQNEAKFKGSDIESLKPNIILLLKKERTQKGLEEWLRAMRDKYGVANYLDG